jgi:hypothetical protein
MQDRGGFRPDSGHWCKLRGKERSSFSLFRLTGSLFFHKKIRVPGNEQLTVCFLQFGDIIFLCGKKVFLPLPSLFEGKFF